MSAFEKGQKNGCWQELNCLISIPTLNIYLKVKLKPLQKLKTGCVNTMLSIYSDPQGQANPTKALENSMGTWVWVLRSSQTPCFSRASESTQRSWGKTSDEAFNSLGACPCNWVGAAGLCSAPLPPSTAATVLIPDTQWAPPATLWV